ncbi:Protein lifeguard 1 [Halotydeus destructor]|nr:Protein lifeguard 1 [Halotydeus destructor]
MDAERNFVATEGQAKGSWDEVAGPFSDKMIRKNFVKKVYMTLGVMLTVTFGTILAFNLIPNIREFGRKHPYLSLVGAGMSLVSIVVLLCCGEFRKKSPQNLICLGIFTLSQSLSLGIMSAFKATDVLLLAVLITGVVCVGITIFAMQSSCDFTVYRGMLLAATLVLFAVGLIIAVTGIFGIHVRILDILYAGAGALIFAFWLLIDTQMIMGGRRGVISPEEYILAVITLYIDIINLFLFILKLVSEAKS